MEEKKLLTIACGDKDLLQEITKLAADRKIDVAIVDESRFQENKVQESNTPDLKTIDGFLSNDENRQIAEAQAKKLYTIMTRGASIEKASEFRFTQKMIVRETTMSHKQAIELFDLLRAFSLMEWTNIKKREFMFTFNKEQCLSSIEKDIINLSGAVATEVIRYKNYLKTMDFTEEEKKNKMKELHKTAIKLMKI
jgi:hypothetical protein